MAVGNGGDGARVIKVEVSFDEGETWKEAVIDKKEIKDENAKVFSWVLWKYDLKVEKPPNEFPKKMTVMVRSFDSAGNK